MPFCRIFVLFHISIAGALSRDSAEKKRDLLISASSSGTNEARRGFMGKIRAFFESPGDTPVFHGIYIAVAESVIFRKRWSRIFFWITGVFRGRQPSRLYLFTEQLT